MTPFNFSGSTPASKSLVNRWQIVQSFCYQNKFNFSEVSTAEDIQDLYFALRDFVQGKKVFECGAGGTTFRFLALRVARAKGEFFLKGTARLLERPHGDLLDVLKQLNVSGDWERGGLKIVSHGWSIPTRVTVPSGVSSQFATSLALSAWGLEKDLQLIFTNEAVSFGYWKMTESLLQQAGMNIQSTSDGWLIPAHSTVKRESPILEPDMSSCFALAAIAAVAGHIRLTQFPLQSVQPDFVFVDVLKSMGVPMRWENNDLLIARANQLKAVNVVLRDSPDLLPVLCMLCAVAHGESHLSGISHTQVKESDRLKKSQELLTKLGVSSRVSSDGDCLSIRGAGNGDFSKAAFLFDPDHDHRMVMAARVAQWMGAKIEISHPQVVAKSFPEFLSWTKLS